MIGGRGVYTPPAFTALAIKVVFSAYPEQQIK